MSTIATAVKHMLAAGMDHAAIVAAVEEMEATTPKPRSAGAIRQERYRRNKASQVTESDVCDTPPSPKRKVSPCTPSKENNPIHPETLGASAPSETASPSKAHSTALDAAQDFERFWSAYPKREGPNPKKPARLAFDRAVKRGVAVERLIAEVVDLARKHPKPTRFCPQAVTWLNQDRALDSEPAVPAPPSAKTDADWARHLQYARQTNKWWVDDWGPMPGDTGCRVPEHLISDDDRSCNFVPRRNAA